MTGASALVAAVARIHGLPDAPVVKPARPGEVNDAVIVGSTDERYVLRTPFDQLASPGYEIEAWCARVARIHGIATPRVLATGAVDGVPYSVQEFVEGLHGGAGPSDALWLTLGAYARVVGEIPVTSAPDALFTRFGRDLSVAWQQHLTYNLDQLDRDDPLIELGVYERTERSHVQALIEILVTAPIELGLSHGDLALRNLLVAPGRPAVLIDWGSAAVGPVPHTDLLNLLRNRDDHGDPSDREIAQFAAGYDVDLGLLRVELDAMRVVTAIDVVRWALDKRPDRLTASIATARTLIGAVRP